MEFHNRQPAEDVNVSRGHPLRRFAVLLLAAAILIVAGVAILQLAGGRIASAVPFRYELALMGKLEIDFGGDESSDEMQNYLQSLADQLLAHMPAAEDISISVHHNGDSIVNAYATIGGNVVLYSGLLARLDSENALAMVMAHEIAHVLHRDPATGLGGGLLSMVALSAITGHSGSGTAAGLLNWSGNLTGVQFTRRMEVVADHTALDAVYRLYGHVAGSEQLFKVLQQAEPSSFADLDSLTAFARTHPRSPDRIESIQTIANAKNWPIDGRLTPLPPQYKSWL